MFRQQLACIARVVLEGSLVVKKYLNRQWRIAFFYHRHWWPFSLDVFDTIGERRLGDRDVFSVNDELAVLAVVEDAMDNGVYDRDYYLH